MRPRKPDLEKVVRESFLDAAASVFAKKGYRAATMNEIAAKAGYTGPALYKYYEGKQQLFEAMLERVDAEVTRTLLEAPLPAKMTLEETVEALVRAAFELVDQRADMLAVIASMQTSADALPSATLMKRQAARQKRHHERAVMMLRRAAGSKRIGEIDADDAATFLGMIGQGLYRRWATKRRDEGEKAAGSFADQVALATHLFFHGVGPAKRSSR